MHPRMNINKTWKRLSWKILPAILLLAALAAPVMADYLGPDRVRTTYETETFDYGVWAVSPTYVPGCSHSPGMDCIVCDWERDPYTASCAYDNIHYYYYTLGTRTETVAHSTTYPPATISASLNGCTLVNGWCASAASLSLAGNEPLSEETILAVEGTLNGSSFGCSGSTCTVPLGEGANAFTYWALSSWGDSSEMGSTSQGQDTQPPTISGEVNGTPGDNGWYVTNATVSATAADAVSGASLSYSLDGASPAVYTGALTLTDGTHTVVFSAVDGAGHTAGASAAANVDTTAPAAAFTSPAGGWLNGGVTVSGTASDATSGLADVQLSLNGGSSWQSLGASTAWSTSWDTTAVGDGTYTLRAYAVDLAGNPGSPVSLNVTIDNTPPQLSLSAPGSFCAECGESIDLTYSVQDSGSGVAGWTLTVDGTPLTSGAAGAGSAFTWDGSGLGTGDHSLALSAVDALGNSDSVTITIRLEAEPPVVPPVVIVNTSRTATQTPTSLPFREGTGGLGVTPTARPTATGGTVTFWSVDSSGEAAPQAEGSPNLLWGAAALSLISATTAIVLNNRKKRKEEEIAEFIACQIEAAKKNIAEEQKKIVNYLSSLSGVQNTSLKMKQAGWSKKEIDKVIKTAQSKAVSKGSGNAAQGSSIDSVLDTAEDNLIKKAWLLKMGIAAATGVSVVSGLISGKEIYCNATAGTPITMVPLSLAGVLPVWGFFANKKNPGRGAILGLLICCMLLSACQGGSTTTPTITATLCTPTLDATATQTLTPTATEMVEPEWVRSANELSINDLYSNYTDLPFLSGMIRYFNLSPNDLEYWQNDANDEILLISQIYNLDPLVLRGMCMQESNCSFYPYLYGDPYPVNLSAGGIMQMTTDGYDFIFRNSDRSDQMIWPFYIDIYTRAVSIGIIGSSVDLNDQNSYPTFAELYSTTSSNDRQPGVNTTGLLTYNGICDSIEADAGLCIINTPRSEDIYGNLESAAMYLVKAEDMVESVLGEDIWSSMSEEDQQRVLIATYYLGSVGTYQAINNLVVIPGASPTWEDIAMALALRDSERCFPQGPGCVITYVENVECYASHLSEEETSASICQWDGE